jgi:hypothetical protein
MSYLIRFLDVIRGTLIAAPTKLLPVMKIPLHSSSVVNGSPKVHGADKELCTWAVEQ